jgi:hypothetical protein
VERASISEAQLLKRELADSAPALLAKIARWRPRVMCFNGKGIWLHVERLLQQQLIHENAANGPRVVVPKRELEHEELKPIIPDIDQERPVKTERVTPRLLQQPPPLKKDTSNDGVATTSGVAVPKKEEEDCEPSVAADTEQGRPSKTKRGRSASGASSTTANSSNLDAGRVLRPSASAPVPVARRSAVVSSPSSSSPVTPRRTATSTFVYGIQPYKAVHDVVPKVIMRGWPCAQGFALTDCTISLLECEHDTRNAFLRVSKQFRACRKPSGAYALFALCVGLYISA